MNEQGKNSNNDNFCMKINIIKPSEDEENLNNAKSPNLLSLGARTFKRKKSKMQQKMENSYCIKKYTNEHGTHGANILKEFHKSRTIIKPNAKESSSNLELNTITENCSKNAEEQNQNASQIPSQIPSQTQNQSQSQSPIQMKSPIRIRSPSQKKNQSLFQNQIENHNANQEIKHNINYSININNSNPNDILNILKLTNNLYTDESHLQKEIPTKKLNINNLTKFDNNFNSNNLTKNKLFIQFGLKNKDRKSYKSTKNIEYNIHKTSFSNFLRLKGNNDDKMIYESKIESSESDEGVKINNPNNTHNFNIGNNSSKSAKNSLLIFGKSKRKKSRSKFPHDKSKKSKEKIKKDSSKKTIKSYKSNKSSKEFKRTNNNSSKKMNKINEEKEENKNEEKKKGNNEEKNEDKNEEKKEETKSDNSDKNKEKEKKFKFRFCSLFCCLNSK